MEREERGRGGEVDSDAQLEQGRRLAKAGPIDVVCVVCDTNQLQGLKLGSCVSGHKWDIMWLTLCSSTPALQSSIPYAIVTQKL